MLQSSPVEISNVPGGALTLTWSMVSYDIKALYWQGMVDVGISNVPGGASTLTWGKGF